MAPPGSSAKARREAELLDRALPFVLVLMGGAAGALYYSESTRDEVANAEQSAA
jgi:hypothetical protein